MPLARKSDGATALQLAEIVQKAGLVPGKALVKLTGAARKNAIRARREALPSVPGKKPMLGKTPLDNLSAAARNQRMRAAVDAAAKRSGKSTENEVWVNGFYRNQSGQRVWVEGFYRPRYRGKGPRDPRNITPDARRNNRLDLEAHNLRAESNAARTQSVRGSQDVRAQDLRARADNVQNAADAIRARRLQRVLDNPAKPAAATTAEAGGGVKLQQKTPAQAQATATAKVKGGIFAGWKKEHVDFRNEIGAKAQALEKQAAKQIGTADEVIGYANKREANRLRGLQKDLDDNPSARDVVMLREQRADLVAGRSGYKAGDGVPLKQKTPAAADGARSTILTTETTKNMGGRAANVEAAFKESPWNGRTAAAVGYEQEAVLAKAARASGDTAKAARHEAAMEELKDLAQGANGGLARHVGGPYHGQQMTAKTLREAKEAAGEDLAPPMKGVDDALNRLATANAKSRAQSGPVKLNQKTPAGPMSEADETLIRNQIDAIEGELKTARRQLQFAQPLKGSKETPSAQADALQKKVTGLEKELAEQQGFLTKAGKTLDAKQTAPSGGVTLNQKTPAASAAVASNPTIPQGAKLDRMGLTMPGSKQTLYLNTRERDLFKALQANPNATDEQLVKKVLSSTGGAEGLPIIQGVKTSLAGKMKAAQQAVSKDPGSVSLNQKTPGEKSPGVISRLLGGKKPAAPTPVAAATELKAGARVDLKDPDTARLFRNDQRTFNDYKGRIDRAQARLDEYSAELRNAVGAQAKERWKAGRIELQDEIKQAQTVLDQLVKNWA